MSARFSSSLRFPVAVGLVCLVGLTAACHSHPDPDAAATVAAIEHAPVFDFAHSGLTSRSGVLANSWGSTSGPAASPARGIRMWSFHGDAAALCRAVGTYLRRIGTTDVRTGQGSCSEAEWGFTGGVVVHGHRASVDVSYEPSDKQLEAQITAAPPG